MKLTFEQLEKNSPMTEKLPDGCGTSFWDDLYYLFRERMEQDIRNGQMVVTYDDR